MNRFDRSRDASLSVILVGAALLACASEPGTSDAISSSSSADSSADATSSGDVPGPTTSGSDSDSPTATGPDSASTSSGDPTTTAPTTGSEGDDSSGGTTGADTDGAEPTTFDERLCTLFVDQATGDDSNSGKSKDQALASVKAATGVVAAGDTVCVYPGTYDGFKNSKNGEQDERIHFVSVERWQARIVSATTPLQNVGEYVDIDGFDVTTTDEAVGVGISIGDGKQASHCRVYNNHVHGIVAKTPGGSGGAGILSAGWVSDAPYQGTDVEIFNNVVHDIGNPGENAGFVQGIYVSHPHAKIYNNIVYNVSGWGIHGWHNANHVTVANNLTSNTDGIVLGNGDSPCNQIKCEFTDYYVSNNILYDDRVGIVLYDGPNHVVSDNNFYMTEPSGDNPRLDDPRLVHYALDGSGDFHPLPDSPMIDAGAAEYAPGFDFAGVTRPQGGGPDIGPFER